MVSIGCQRLTQRISRYEDCSKYAKSAGRCFEADFYLGESNRVFQICSGADSTVKSDDNESLEGRHNGEIRNDERKEKGSHTH